MSESAIKAHGADRYTLFPIFHPNLWKFYKQHEASFWTVEELRLSDDLADWNTRLSDNERHFIKMVLAFFAGSDGIVNENLVANFCTEVELSEARAFYTVQMMMETIHSETYSVLIDTYIANEDEKNALFKAIDTFPAIRKKADWALRWISDSSALLGQLPAHVQTSLATLHADARAAGLQTAGLDYLLTDKKPFAQRLLAFVCVEGIFFSGSFCAIYWLKNKGLMPGLCTSNEFISRDENLHCEFAIELYNMLENRLPQDIAHSIFKEAVDIEKEFVSESLPVSLIGMNKTLMQQYIEYVADRWLVMLGYRKLYDASNPFSFMELISLNQKTNFFESVNSVYRKSGVGTVAQDRTFALDEDF